MAAPRGPDPAIKLFGRTIALPDSAGAAAEVSTKLTDAMRNNSGTKCIPNKLLNIKSSSFCSKDSSLNGTQSVNSQSARMETDPKPEEVKTESDGSGQEKELKKPDKILPCPRCDSMETKFCYFNNYNVNQPRHFCRSCKRYWTAGGTMRNVPIGAGRRRNKHPSHHCHAMMSCDGNVSSGDTSDAIHRQSLPVEPCVLQRVVRENEEVTKSGSDMSFCKSKVPVLNTKEKNNSLGSVDNKEEKSCATSSTASGCSENWMPENTVTIEQNNVLGNDSGVKETHPHIQSYPAGPALVVPWSPGWNSLPGMASTQCSTECVHGLENGTASKVSLPLPIMMPAPGLSAPAVPFPLMPPLWSYIPGWPNGTWSSPWPANNGSTLPSTPHNIPCSGNNSPKLGKHSREETMQGEEKKGNSICVPKILRITDPEDAAKSLIFASLGIKPDEKSIFKSFQPEVLGGCKTPEPPQVQQANPAAVSRSQSFQERT
ncbi:hypothetical protein QOZ80_1AG0003700 [Eleusine coracana subsp. coracana]|nr:hypothetical protein QOZ80_1AG0003700 [Eleusine coracana subsp. coracana]